MLEFILAFALIFVAGMEYGRLDHGAPKFRTWFWIILCSIIGVLLMISLYGSADNIIFVPSEHTNYRT